MLASDEVRLGLPREVSQIISFFYLIEQAFGDALGSRSCQTGAPRKSERPFKIFLARILRTSCCRGSWGCWWQFASQDEPIALRRRGGGPRSGLLRR